MNPQTVLRFVNATGGWPGKVLVIGCEPGAIDDVGLGLSPAVAHAVDRATRLVRDTIDELRTDAAYAG
jgi:hydrogenase maturation protease